MQTCAVAYMTKRNGKTIYEWDGDLFERSPNDEYRTSYGKVFMGVIARAQCCFRLRDARQWRTCVVPASIADLRQEEVMGEAQDEPEEERISRIAEYMRKQESRIA